jgi:hypothetical protein
MNKKFKPCEYKKVSLHISRSDCLDRIEIELVDGSKFGFDVKNGTQFCLNVLGVYPCKTTSYKDWEGYDGWNPRLTW